MRLAAIKLLQQQQIFSPVAAEWRPAFVEALRAAVRDPKVRAAALEVLSLFKDRPTQELLLEGIRKPERGARAPAGGAAALEHRCPRRCDRRCQRADEHRSDAEEQGGAGSGRPHPGRRPGFGWHAGRGARERRLSRRRAPVGRHGDQPSVARRPAQGAAGSALWSSPAAPPRASRLQRAPPSRRGISRSTSRRCRGSADEDAGRAGGVLRLASSARFGRSSIATGAHSHGGRPPPRRRDRTRRQCLYRRRFSSCSTSATRSIAASAPRR